MSTIARGRGRPRVGRLDKADVAFIKKEIKAIYVSLSAFYKEAFNEATAPKYRGFDQPADIDSVKRAFAAAFSLDRALPPLYLKVLEELLNLTPDKFPSAATATETGKATLTETLPQQGIEAKEKILQSDSPTVSEANSAPPVVTYADTSPQNTAIELVSAKPGWFDYSLRYWCERIAGLGARTCALILAVTIGIIAGATFLYQINNIRHLNEEAAALRAQIDHYNSISANAGSIVRSFLDGATFGLFAEEGLFTELRRDQREAATINTHITSFNSRYASAVYYRNYGLIGSIIASVVGFFLRRRSPNFANRAVQFLLAIFT